MSRPAGPRPKLHRTSVVPRVLTDQPVLGETLKEGGVELQLTLLDATTMQPLSDAHNPRQGEGLFLGRGGSSSRRR